MTARLKPYPKMADSGVDWLEQIPEQWTVRRIKSLFREKDERGNDGLGTLLSLTRSQGIVPQRDISSRVSATDLSKYKVCLPGDLIMNRMQAWSGMFSVSTLAGLVSPDYSVFVPIIGSEGSARFFEHLFKTPMLVGEFAKRSKGIGTGFNRLYTPDFGAVSVAVAPPSEQTAIARFLDHMDSRIQKYIRAKEKLIALLDEYKQALIHQAVTGQIDVRRAGLTRSTRSPGWSGIRQIPKH